ncbi:MAG: hypothetical protein WA996_18975 [Candidatus Promineifilaceae bacterium]
MSKELVGVNDRNDTIQADAVAEIGLHEGHGNAGWVGDAARFEKDILRLFGSADDHLHRLHLIITDIATNTAIGQADAVILYAHNQLSINVD